VAAPKFWTQSVVQAGRKGTGYYDFLKLTKRDDFFKLVGLDEKRAREAKREVAAIIKDSGVAELNRQVFRKGATDAGYWVTLDVFDDETGRKNAIANLDDDYQHDAEEHYGVLPNRLFAYYLSDATGVQQDSAPDKVGPDQTRSSNRGRIDICNSCVACHVEGLRPLNDHARKLFAADGPVRLQAVDRAKFNRLRQLCLGELDRHLAKDRDDYAFYLHKLTGWKPAELSAAYRKWWRLLNDEAVSLARMAAEFGTTEAHLTAAVTGDPQRQDAHSWRQADRCRETEHRRIL
jgi:hypothetical protein